MTGVIVGFLQNDTTLYKLPVAIIMIIRVKHISVVIYNINAMQIKLISCADISEI